jgi:hypothetical protein
MARGGKREGAGRKPGTPNKATQEQRDAIEASGLTPLEYMLSVMRNESADESRRLDAAKSAAPYVHPRLSAVEHSGEMAFMSHEQWLEQLG